MKDILYIVSTAGPDTGLEDLTHERCLPLIRMGSRGALMDFVLFNCLASNTGDVAVLDERAPALVDRYLRVFWTPAFNSSARMALASAVNGGGEVRAAVELLKGLDEMPETVILLHADEIYRMDYRYLADAHKESGAAVTEVMIEPFGDGSFISVSPKIGEAASWAAARANPNRPYPSMGVRALDPKVLLEWAGDTGAAEGGALFGSFVQSMAAEGRRATMPSRLGYYRKVDSLWSYWRANMELLGHKDPSLKFSPLPGMGRGPFAKREIVRESANGEGWVLNSAVGAGARIDGAFVRNSVIAPGVTVEEGALVKNSVVLDGAVIRRGAGLAGKVAPRLSEVKKDGLGALDVPVVGFANGSDIDHIRYAG